MSPFFFVQILIIGAILLFGVYLFIAEGIPNAANLPATYWDPFASEEITSYFVWLAIFVFPSLLLRLDHWQRIVTAESNEVAQRGYVSAGIVLFVVFSLFLMVGSYATMAGSSDPFWIYKNNLLINGNEFFKFLYGLSFMAFIAAIISSADTILNSISAFISQTLSAWSIFKTSKSWISIVINSVITILALILALSVHEIVPLIVEGFKAMIILLPAIVAAIMLKRPNNFAASFSLLGGIATYLVVRFVWPEVSNWAYVIAFAVSLITVISVYHFDKQLARIRLTR